MKKHIFLSLIFLLSATSLSAMHRKGAVKQFQRRTEHARRSKALIKYDRKRSEDTTMLKPTSKKEVLSASYLYNILSLLDHKKSKNLAIKDEKDASCSIPTISLGKVSPCLALAFILAIANPAEACDKFCYEKARAAEERAAREKARAGAPNFGPFGGEFYGAAVGHLNAERNRIAANGAFFHNLWG